MGTWKATHFRSWTASGVEYARYIYKTVTNVGHDYVCAWHCKLETACSFYALVGTNCHLGDCEATESIIGDQANALVYYKSSDLTRCFNTYSEDNRFDKMWRTYVFARYEYYTDHAYSVSATTCSIFCKLHESGRCHFFATYQGWCLFGDFGSRKNELISYLWDDGRVIYNSGDFGKYLNSLLREKY